MGSHFCPRRAVLSALSRGLHIADKLPACRSPTERVCVWVWVKAGLCPPQEHRWDNNNLSGVVECQLGWIPLSQIYWQGEKPAVFGLVLAKAHRLSG